ncbi:MULTISPECIES: SPFH domain-containing protein [unclassified Nodularia (in: cyanobacteria)]|uniref:flotillin family protein n=1 Tax=unclassified Nodularia (in: cyanobacteria) TaxID=2656917 RepID=UPI0018801FCF|nr:MULTISPECIES: SPFH domain-containing protein [unclassified Nodularia (in: cyanobacteria)]MBE9197893.1 flotillin family protein [Nodularia sp. LEGE 06071]MCC2695489.1 flotillin family protein [Nodularia sp. LEGE 04288]
MLFWLTFIQSLPTIPVSEISPIQLQPKQDQNRTFAQTISPVTVPPTIAQINNGLVLPGVIAALIFLLLLSLYAYTRIYVVTPNNEAFVRTGGLFTKKKSVILYGGCIVLPGFHQLTRVPLREISIDVERTGKMAVRTKDYLRADIRVTFYVCINASEEDVLKAAARLSQSGTIISSDDIKNALEKRADDAIRAAAKTKEIAEIDSDKLGFAQEVLNLVGPDLKKVGLTLNNIAISEILESVTYDPDSFFDAQGVRLRTEIIQRSIQQKREVELTTQVAIEQKELDAQKRSLQIAQEQESARLEQKFQVEALKAQREREIQEAKDKEAAAIQRSRILQEKSVEEEEIRKKLSLQQSQIDADIALEERNKHLNVSQSLQKQEAEIAEISRKQKVEAGRLKAQVEIVESEKLARIAQEDLEIAISAKKRESFLAQAQQATAEASVQTAGEIEKAERNKRLSTIAAEREAQQRSISDRNVVEIDAFRRRRQAEIAQEAAELEAEAIRILAAANRDKVLAEAEALKVKIAAENTISNANLTAQMLTTIWPGLADKLPEILTALAPQPGVLGDTRIYSFPGANGSNGAQDINKLMLSTSGLSLINTLLDEGKLGELIGQVSQLVRSNNQVITDTDSNLSLINNSIPTHSQSNKEIG